MNINLKLNNIIEKQFLNQLYSVRIKIVTDKQDIIETNIFDDLNIFFKIKNVLDNGRKYIIIISVAALGSQILKKRYSFVYKKCENYILDGNCYIIDNNKTNAINVSDMVSLHKYKVNPLSSYRFEKNVISVYLNGNIYLLRKHTREIYQSILNGKTIKEDDFNVLNKLIEKGLIICYE